MTAPSKANPRPARSSVLSALILAAFSALMWGCQAPKAPPATAARVEIDPCSERLHDLCGPLLQYYALHRDLPETLAELFPADSQPASPPACPAIGKCYVYDPQGVLVPGLPGRLIVHDAEPSHAGRRWGILAEPPQPGQPLILRVVQVSESAFRRATPAAP